MKQINLIPWRENAREEQKKQFFNILAASLVVTLLLLICIHVILANSIRNQNKINSTYSREIDTLNQKLGDIEQLKSEQRAIRNRIGIIDKLQANRSQAAYIFIDMVKVMPTGVYLLAMKRVDDVVALGGRADSNAVVSNFMRNLDTLTWVKETSLHQIQAITKSGSYNNEFMLEIKLKPLQDPGEIIEEAEAAANATDKSGKKSNAKSNKKAGAQAAKKPANQAKPKTS